MTPILSSFMNYHRICIQINTTSITSGAGTAYLSKPKGVIRIRKSKDGQHNGKKEQNDKQ
jgi:hypothetical protein